MALLGIPKGAAWPVVAVPFVLVALFVWKYISEEEPSDERKRADWFELQLKKLGEKFGWTTQQLWDLGYTVRDDDHTGATVKLRLEKRADSGT